MPDADQPQTLPDEGGDEIRDIPEQDAPEVEPDEAPEVEADEPAVVDEPTPEVSEPAESEPVVEGERGTRLGDVWVENRPNVRYTIVEVDEDGEGATLQDANGDEKHVGVDELNARYVHSGQKQSFLVGHRPPVEDRLPGR